MGNSKPTAVTLEVGCNFMVKNSVCDTMIEPLCKLAGEELVIYCSSKESTALNPVEESTPSCPLTISSCTLETKLQSGHLDTRPGKPKSLYQ